MHRDANVSSSISFDLLNSAVIFPHWYGKTSEKTQVAAYLTETSGIAECKIMTFHILSFFNQRKMLPTFTIVLWWYMYNIAQKVNYAIYRCYIFINCFGETFDTANTNKNCYKYSSWYNKMNSNFCVGNCF